MNKLLRVLQTIRPAHLTNQCRRTFLSQAYNCSDAWNQRSSSQILSKVNLDDLYYELDQRYQKSGVISAVDVDIFANKVQDDIYVDELLDLIHKLRMSSETSNTLNSTGHAVIRYLLTQNKTSDLLNVLDDRLNYGIFLDYYTANLLMDHFYKQKDYTAGCRVASQMILQEEVDHPITKALALLHCYKYLCDPQGWPEVVKPEEPEEEVKIRVKFLRNPYDDGHFDLRDGPKIVGKTLMEFTRNSQQSDLHKSLHTIGRKLLENEVDVKTELESIENIEKQLEEAVVQAEQKVASEDITQQVKLFNEWEQIRQSNLEKQILRLETARRIENIKKTQEDLKAREEKLWFFENEEQIELSIENKRVYHPKRWFGKKRKPRKIDEGYVPPEL